MIETVIKNPLTAEIQPRSNGVEVSAGSHVNLQTQTVTLLDHVQGCTRQVATLDARVLELISRVDIVDSRSRVQAQATDHLTELCSRLEKAVQLLDERLDSQDGTYRSLRDELRQGRVELKRPTGAELRLEPRVFTQKAVNVMVPGGSEVAIAGAVVNASHSGLGLLLEAPVPVGGEIHLDVDGTLLSGGVCYCRSQGKWYAVGLNAVMQLDAPATKDVECAKPARPPAGPAV
jgi:hypothetical protein